MHEHLIAVTGSTGVTGQHLIPRLSARGLTFRCLVRDIEKARDTLGDDIELDHGDLDDRGSLDQALSGVHTLFLNSGHSPILEAQQSGKMRNEPIQSYTVLVKDDPSEAAM